jgi:hypothetical protein
MVGGMAEAQEMMSYEERIEAALKACGNDEFVVDSVLRAFCAGDTLYVMEQGDPSGVWDYMVMGRYPIHASEKSQLYFSALKGDT